MFHSKQFSFYVVRFLLPFSLPPVRCFFSSSISIPFLLSVALLCVCKIIYNSRNKRKPVASRHLFIAWFERRGHNELYLFFVLLHSLACTYLSSRLNIKTKAKKKKWVKGNGKKNKEIVFVILMQKSNL